VIRAVLDANVLVSGVVGVRIPTSAPGELIRCWRQRELTIVVSSHLLQEVERTLAKPYFASRLSAAQASSAVQLLKRRAEMTEVTAVVSGVATHPEDDLVLATAISAKVRYLVTGDAQLQSVGRYRGVTVVSPARFVALLAATGRGL
jgi:putative PIN family toxin of toxin-antitoxin system